MQFDRRSLGDNSRSDEEWLMHESFWAKVLFREFTGHFIAMNEQEIVADVKASIVALTRLSEEGDSFGAKMVRWANERIYANSEKNRINGSKGGRPRKNSPDTRGGSAKPSGCASSKRIPTQEYTTAAGESAEKLDPPDIGGSAASAGRSLPPRAGEVNDSPKVSGQPHPEAGCASGKRTPPSTAELYDFAEAARLSEADAREWWELCTERGWKDRSGKPIRDWKKACERYCAKRAINRMAKGET